MSSSETRCPACNHELAADAHFCVSCGTPTQTGITQAASAATSEPSVDPLEAEYEIALKKALGAEYELLEPIGEGGFAKVYKARDVRLDRLVAIKVIRPDLAGAQAFLDRFRKEGVSLAKLRHPGIVPIYDIRQAGSLIYYIMPFIEGENLRSRLERLGRLPPFEAHRILSELADAITAAHRAGIIHRDIKPENIILEGNLKKVLLMDFGIAKATEPEGKRLTGSGVLVGTPRYMSPEQAAGDAEIDQRADIYSLGVLGYHMVVGELPFTGTPQQVIVKHITETPTPVRQLNPSVPKGFSDTIARCLAKKPSERFETAMDLWRELQTVTFFRPEPDRKAQSSIPKLEVIASFVLVIGLISGFAVGKLVYDRSATEFAQPTAQRSSATNFVTGWLSDVRNLNNEFESDSIRNAVRFAFDRLATIARVTPGSDPASPAVQLTPRQLLRNPTYVKLLAEIEGPRMLVRDYGNTAVVSTSYSDSASACGAATLTLQLAGTDWKVLLIEFHDFGEGCTP
jgi:serine/threonine protein kinase